MEESIFLQVRREQVECLHKFIKSNVPAIWLSGCCGSGKTKILRACMKVSRQKAIYIDCHLFASMDCDLTSIYYQILRDLEGHAPELRASKTKQAQRYSLTDFKKKLFSKSSLTFAEFLLAFRTLINFRCIDKNDGFILAFDNIHSLDTYNIGQLLRLSESLNYDALTIVGVSVYPLSANIGISTMGFSIVIPEICFPSLTDDEAVQIVFDILLKDVDEYPWMVSRQPDVFIRMLVQSLSSLYKTNFHRLLYEAKNILDDFEPEDDAIINDKMLKKFLTFIGTYRKGFEQGDVELSSIGKLITIASFVSSFNKPEVDAWLFEQIDNKRMLEREAGGKTRRTARQVANFQRKRLDTESVTTRLPSPFLLSRMLNIACQLQPEYREVLQESFLSEVTILTSIGILVAATSNTVMKQSGFINCQYICKAKLFFIEQISKDIRIDLSEVLCE